MNEILNQLPGFNHSHYDVSFDLFSNFIEKKNKINKKLEQRTLLEVIGKVVVVLPIEFSL